jgi:hypothetical protein
VDALDADKYKLKTISQKNLYAMKFPITINYQRISMDVLASSKVLACYKQYPQ